MVVHMNWKKERKINKTIIVLIPSFLLILTILFTTLFDINKIYSISLVSLLLATLLMNLYYNRKIDIDYFKYAIDKGNIINWLRSNSYHTQRIRILSIMYPYKKVYVVHNENVTFVILYPWNISERTSFIKIGTNKKFVDDFDIFYTNIPNLDEIS